MRLNRQRASDRSKKGWRTRKQRHPGVYQRSKKSYDWQRPSGERVGLHGFNENQLKQIMPALKHTDQNLQRDIRLRRTDVKIGRRGEVERTYKRHFGPNNHRVAGLTQPRRIFRSTVTLNPKAFKPNGYYDPKGVFVHELAHLGHEKRLKSRSYRQDFVRDFQWKADRKGNFTPSRHHPGRARTRQKQNPFEDMAETYRKASGFNMTRQHNSYFDVAIDQSRVRHLRKHYLT